MKKEVYVCYSYFRSDTDEPTGLDLMLLGKEDDIRNMDNLIVRYPLRPSPTGGKMISLECINRLAALQNLGYPICFFF